MSATFAIHDGFLPGCIGRIAALHGLYYEPQWGLAKDFEARVAMGLGAFALRYVAGRDLMLIALHDETVIGGLVLDLGDPDSEAHFGPVLAAHLRFFILDDDVRGTGVGTALLDHALAHADRRCGGRVWLTTFAGLDAARHMYERRGFRLTEEERGTRWGFELADQTFVRTGPRPAGRSDPL